MIEAYERLAPLPLMVEECELEALSFSNPDGWTRPTTVIRLRGRGEEGVGEDVTWQSGDHEALRSRGDSLALRGEWTFDAFSSRLETLDVFGGEPEDAGAVDLRRWGFESAALDLALRQARTTLAEVVGRAPRPLRFVASLGLGDPPSLEPLRVRRRADSDLEFKVDYEENWSPDLVATLAEFGGVRVVDLKGQYRGAFQGPEANAWMYRRVAETLGDAWIEDPEWNECTSAALEPHVERVSWDAVLHSVADIESLPFRPRCVNIKPSRFGSVRELFAAYQHCADSGIAMYGGGQFELGPGRGQAQVLAALFHPDAPNDLAPGVYNEPERLTASAPTSPLTLEPGSGFRLAGD